MTTTESPDARVRERVVDGVRTRWVEYGDPTHPPLLALHGLRGTHEGLGPIARRLAGLHVVVPDLPGFGATAPFEDRPHDVAGYARWAAALVAATSSPPTLLGHSFGTVVAAAAAARAGIRVRGLVLVNPITRRATGPGALAAAAVHEATALIGLRARNALLRHRALADLATLTMTTTADPALRAWVREEHRTHFVRFADVHALGQAFRAARTGTIARYVPALDAPTLLVAGARDQVAPLQGIDALRSAFPQVDLEIVPEVGHLLHYEAPDEVAAIVQDFLERVG